MQKAWEKLGERNFLKAADSLDFTNPMFSFTSTTDKISYSE